MNLNADDLEVAYYVFARFINGRLAAAKPVPAAVRTLFKRIELMSVTGHESECDAEELGEELIGTAEVADILDCDPRHVRRLANDLDGRRINGRWVFTKALLSDTRSHEVATDEVVRAQAEEYLAELPDDEFAAVVRRVRPPRAPKPDQNQGKTESPEENPAQQFARFLNQQLNGDHS